MQVIPEKIIKESAKVMSKEEVNNTFSQALEIGQQFKLNGLMPVYLIDNKDMTIYVTSKENLLKKFN